MLIGEKQNSQKTWTSEQNLQKSKLRESTGRIQGEPLIETLILPLGTEIPKFGIQIVLTLSLDSGFISAKLKSIQVELSLVRE